MKKFLGLILVLVCFITPAFANTVSQEVLDQAKTQAGLFMDLKNALGLDWLDEYNAYLANPTTAPQPAWENSVAALIAENYLPSSFPDDFTITPTGQEVTISRIITNQGIKGALPIYLPSISIVGDTVSLLVQRPAQWVAWQAGLNSKISRDGEGYTDSTFDVLPDTILEFGSRTGIEFGDNSKIEFINGDGKLIGVDSLEYKDQELDDRFVNITGDNMTGALTISGNKVWHAGNDGSGSGLDADLLDGQHGSFYRDASNLNAGIVPVARLSGTYDIDIGGRANVATNADHADQASNSDMVDGNHASDFIYKPIRLYAGDDLNNITTPGMYYCMSDAEARQIANAPVTHSFSLFVERHYGCKQTVTEHASNNVRNYIRISYKGNWTPWETSVSRSGDTMTGVLSAPEYILQSNGKITLVKDGEANVFISKGAGYASAGMAVRVQTNYGYVDIGSTNADHAHFMTDRPMFYFNKPIGALEKIQVYGTGTYFTKTEGKINNNKVWHERNDGSGSGLDADLLDGQHASNFITKPITIVEGTDLDSLLTPGLYYCNGGAVAMTLQHSPSSGSMAPFMMITEGKAHRTQTIKECTPTHPRIWVRSHLSYRNMWGPWTEVAGKPEGYLRIKEYSYPGTYTWTKGPGTQYIIVYLWGTEDEEFAGTEAGKSSFGDVNSPNYFYSPAKNDMTFGIINVTGISSAPVVVGEGLVHVIDPEKHWIRFYCGHVIIEEYNCMPQTTLR